MARPQPQDHWSEPESAAGYTDWNSLRDDLENLLKQVENRQLFDESPAGRAAPRQPHDAEARHRAALRSVQKAVERFSEAARQAAQPRDELESAISEIRARTAAPDDAPASHDPREPGYGYDHGPLPARQGPQAGENRHMPRPMPRGRRTSAPEYQGPDYADEYGTIEPAPRHKPAPRNDGALEGLRQLTGAVSAMTGRLERLEADMRATRDASGDIAEVAAQVSQLTHVVELLAGAVGEQSHIKRLESQIADLARLYAEGEKPEITALTRRIDELGATVDRLVNMQVEGTGRADLDLEALTSGQAEVVRLQAEAKKTHEDGMRAIEDGVRNIYDRIDVLERAYAIGPDDLERLTLEMGNVTEALNNSSDAETLAAIVARLDALSGQIDGMGQTDDASISGLREDVRALSDAVRDAVEPRFASLESRIDNLSNKMGAAEPPPPPDFSEIEEQIRQLTARMDQTGQQLQGLTELYKADAERESGPDLHELARLVAASASEEMARMRGEESGLGETDLDRLEERLSGLIDRQQANREPEELGNMAENLTRVDERLDRLEATLVGLSRQVSEPDMEAPPSTKAGPELGRHFQQEAEEETDPGAAPRSASAHEPKSAFEYALESHAEDEDAFGDDVPALILPHFDLELDSPDGVHTAGSANPDMDSDAEEPSRNHAAAAGPAWETTAEPAPGRDYGDDLPEDDDAARPNAMSGEGLGESIAEPSDAMPAPRREQRDDAMPHAPDDSRPLVDDELSLLIAPVEDWSSIGFDDPLGHEPAKPATPEADAARHPGLSPEDTPAIDESEHLMTPEREQFGAPLPTPAPGPTKAPQASSRPEEPASGFDAASVERPAPPRSSFEEDVPGFTPMSDQNVDHDETEDDSEPVIADRSAFIAAARRAVRSNQSAKDTLDDSPKSLFGRALARFQSSAKPEKADPALQAEEPAVEPVFVKEPTPEFPRGRATLEDFEADLESDEFKRMSGEKTGSFITRNRRALVLAAALVATVALAANLVVQRLNMPASGGSSAVSLAEPETDALTGTLLDPAPTGTIDPVLATDLAPQASPRQVLPATLTNEPLPGASALDPTFTHSVPPVVEEPQIPATPAPIKLELPPETLGPIALRQAAADGDPRAQFEIGAIYTEGSVIPQDFKSSAVWYERAAAQGFGPAQYRLGNLYEHGDGVDKDLEEARLWYSRAAEGGNRMAMHNLASLYASGELGEQQFATAAEWFERAADTGLTDSQFNLGMLYARGLGVTQDLKASYKWFALAAEQGDKDAAMARDDIGKSLDADALKAAEAEVANWHMSPINIPANFAPIGTWTKDFDPGQTITEKKVTEGVQRALARLGYDPGSVDGVMGPKTNQAIKDFEQATGMAPTGLVNPRLLAVLGSQPV